MDIAINNSNDIIVIIIIILVIIIFYYIASIIIVNLKDHSGQTLKRIVKTFYLFLIYIVCK